ncbi:hypothetical protein C1645_850633 [Glomus cerebriforme]|uniref:Uncharacterized protein n=1 Tax=Glomus cerebriforme TaxID=658196 RepID=A0A397T0S6_9GLOM|nr:hypothetical protein C1645_850633 [Glomus cerebriforme]
MGATISTYTDKFYDEKVHELKQGNRTNLIAALVKGISDNSKINRNIIYLVRGIVSVFYEEALDHQTHKLEEAYKQNQRNSITINELKAKLAAVSKTHTSLNQKSKVDNSAEKEPIVIEDEDITILSTHKGSTSTIDTNDTVERIMIANAESSYMTSNNDQQTNQKVVHMKTDKENPKPQPTEEVRKPDKSSEKKKHKKSNFMPYIITGYTVPPKLKDNIHDIMLYDIPGNWDAEQITEAINKSLGSLIKVTLKKQGKYYSVRASVVLRTRRIEDLEEYQTWQTMLGLRQEKLKDTSLSKNKSSKKWGGSKQDSVADILAKALAKIMAGKKSLSQEKEKE